MAGLHPPAPTANHPGRAKPGTKPQCCASPPTPTSYDPDLPKARTKPGSKPMFNTSSYTKPCKSTLYLYKSNAHAVCRHVRKEMQKKFPVCEWMAQANTALSFWCSWQTYATIP